MRDLFNDSAAVISECGLYRYRLERTWHRGAGVVCWIMLNPSTATAEQDDPTIRRCVSFARSWGAGGIVVVNLFAYRATDPKTLFDVFYRKQFSGPDGAVCYHNGDPVGPENDAAILDAAIGSPAVVAAWGAHGVMMLRDAHVLDLLWGYGIRPQCLGLTKDGQPRHPLYVSGATKLVPMERR